MASKGVLYTYSALNLNGVISSPLYTIMLAGTDQAGINRVSVRMDTNHARLRQAVDGAQVALYVPGESGVIEFSVWQTSDLQQKFMNAYNAVLTQAQSGYVYQAFSAIIHLTNTSDGSSYTATGCMLQRPPDKPFQEQAGEVNWVYTCAQINGEALAPQEKVIKFTSDTTIDFGLTPDVVEQRLSQRRR